MERPELKTPQTLTEEIAIKGKTSAEQETVEDIVLSSSPSGKNKITRYVRVIGEHWVITDFSQPHSLDHLGVEMCSKKQGSFLPPDTKSVLRKISEDRVGREDNTKLSLAEKNALRRKRSLSLDPQILLHWAAAHNDVDTLKGLVEITNVNVNEPGIDGLYPLHRAATAGSFDSLQYLVTKGAQLDVHDKRGTSPLDAAVCEGEFDCARFLIENGANIAHIRDGFVDTDFPHSRKRFSAYT